MKKRVIGIWLVVFVSFFGIGQEICDNGIDDDADGLVDLNDVTDCSCNTLNSMNITPLSLIPNPSFEEYTDCPNDVAQINSATGWVQATDGTADYMNTCGFMFPAITSSGLIPFPDGNGIAGIYMTKSYQELIGSCLTSPLLSGHNYTLKFFLASNTIYDDIINTGKLAPYGTYGPTDLTIYGTKNCNDYPLYGFDCPSEADPGVWNELGKTSYTPQASWNSITINFTPTTDINAFMLGGPCETPNNFPNPPGNILAYFYLDKLTLNETKLFDPISISETGSYCSNDLVLNTTILNGLSITNPTYQWYKNGIAISGATNSTYSVPTGINGLGDYQVRLSDGGLCAISAKNTVTTKPPTISVLGVKSELCKGDSTTITVSGSTTFNWSPSETLSASTGASVLAKPTQTTTYTVVAGENSCTSSQEITITVKDTKADAGKDTSICIGSSITLNASGGATYVWSHGETTANISVSPTTETNYIVTAKDGICSNKDSVLVIVNPLPIVTLPAEIILTAFGSTVLSASGGQSYLWTPATGLSCTTCESPSASPSEDTEYCVVVTDVNKCKSSACTTIKINLDCGELFIPNSFSPNGDNNNDKLEVKIIPTCVESYDFKIFDRWGEKVFETTKITDSWDGKFNGKDLDNAVFVYSLTIKLKDKTEPIVKNGNVSIIK